jgi:hypothetical protein
MEEIRGGGGEEGIIVLILYHSSYSPLQPYHGEQESKG